jgi:hypothetical protein
MTRRESFARSDTSFMHGEMNLVHAVMSSVRGDKSFVHAHASILYGDTGFAIAESRSGRTVRNNTDKLALVALVVGLAGVWTWLRQRETPVSSPWPGEQAESPKNLAEQIRSKAASARAAKMWHECLDSLDRAREIDPAGDVEPRVQEMRREAEAALARESAPAPSGEH